MKRRLYFLFPDAAQARSAAEDLVGCGVGKRHMHAVARAGVALDGLPETSARQRHDLLHHLERLWWNTNLVLFFAAFIGLLLGLISGATVWIMVMFAVMIVTLVLGSLEARLPDMPLDAMRDALRHGEVLLLVDVPQAHVAEVATFLRTHHPEVAVGGVSWTIERFGM